MTTLRNTDRDSFAAWRLICELGRVIDGDMNRALPVVHTAIMSLHHGPLGCAIRQGHVAFESGSDVDDALDRLVAHAFEARMRLTDALAAMSAHRDVTALVARVRALDDWHAQHDGAVWLVDEMTYRCCASGVPLDETTWWGARARVDHIAPPHIVRGALGALATGQ